MNHAKKMWEVKLAKKPLAVLVGALLQAAYGYAQEAPAADGAAAVDANNKGLNLETVVVTGTSSKTTKMRSSISVSSLDGDQLLANQPQNASDLLSTIPGIFVQSSGGGGGASGGEQVVDDVCLLSGPKRVDVHFDGIGAVLEGVLL